MDKKVVIDPEIMHGTPVLEGTRIPVYVILDYLTEGYDFERIKKAYPHLTDEHIIAAIRFASETIRDVSLEKVAS